MTAAAPELRKSARRPAAPEHPARTRERVSVSVTPVAWSVDEDLAFSQWLDQGRRLGVAGRGAGWWIGDWVRYGAVRYGGRYTRAAKVTGYDYKTLMNMVYVSSRFEISRRRERLSWSHHAELASLEVEEQEHWLDRIESEKLTVRRLREELARGPRALHDCSAGKQEPDHGTHASGEAVCPNCGCESVCPHCGHPIGGGGDGHG